MNSDANGRDRQKKLLLALLAALVLAVIVRTRDIGGGAAGGGGAAAGGRSRAVAVPTGGVEKLALADLSRTPPGFRVGRDPWRFYEPPPPPPPPPRLPTKEELERQRLALEEAARQAALRAQRDAEEARKPKPPALTFRYLGSFGPKGSPIAVLADGKEVLNVRQGEIVRGKFEVAKIGLESVDIKFVGFPDVPAQRLAVGR